MFLNCCSKIEGEKEIHRHEQWIRLLVLMVPRCHADLTGFVLYATMIMDVKAIFTEAWRGGRFLLENALLFE